MGKLEPNHTLPMKSFAVDHDRSRLDDMVCCMGGREQGCVKCDTMGGQVNDALNT